jgi:flagellar basal body-associated protein FliL
LRFLATEIPQPMDKTVIIITVIVVVCVIAVGIVFITVYFLRSKNKNSMDGCKDPFLPLSTTDTLAELLADGTGSGSGKVLQLMLK